MKIETKRKSQKKFNSMIFFTGISIESHEDDDDHNDYGLADNLIII